MNGILDWEAFAFKFRGNPQISFEKLAYHMFCRKYRLTEGLPAFYDQKHISTILRRMLTALGYIVLDNMK